jgi:hypothetical protein|tara:strand:- start:988 stop:1158 length:171 start_codon:yes stop_codon:yes gene_type:complete
MKGITTPKEEKVDALITKKHQLKVSKMNHDCFWALILGISYFLVSLTTLAALQFRP